MRLQLLLALALGASFIGSNCGGVGVGDPCVPEEEYLSGFPGFSYKEVNVESKSFSCLSRICLVNHFHGRVSCPYGQSAENAALCADPATAAQCNPGQALHEASCRVPDRDGSDAADRITVKVDPQYQTRKADDTVYCSCRCGGPDPNARYCKCPSGYDCEQLVDELGLGRGQLAGSYCVKAGTSFDPSNPPSDRCSADGATCGFAVNEGGQVKGVNPPDDRLEEE